MRKEAPKNLLFTKTEELGGYEPLPKNQIDKSILSQDKEFVWDVKTDKKGSGFICRRQEDAELLAYLIRIDERLKRVEKMMLKIATGKQGIE
jgi:hypothetical protein